MGQRGLCLLIVISLIVHGMLVLAPSMTAGSDPMVALRSLPVMAGGSDVWTAELGARDLFRPHVNDCDAVTEAFVPITSDGRGFCIELDDRPPMQWEAARHACLLEGKRLPEFAEWQFACDLSGELGLLEMTGSWEWSSNFVIAGSDANGQGPLNVVASGDEGCNSAAQVRAARSNGSGPHSRDFRCVR